jgi:hypothetical protein
MIDPSKMSFRFATQDDAPAFAEWAAKNPQIDPKDLVAGTKEQNPTTTYLVIEEDGIPRLFIPVFLTMRIAYLAFNPENTRDQNLAALEMMLPFVKGLAGTFHINEIDVLTKSTIPIAQWAQVHNFKADDRELFSLSLEPPVVNSPETSPEKQVD